MMIKIVSSRIADLVAPGISAIRPYEPGKPIEEVERELGISDVVKLASNENPLGPSPLAVAALHAAVKNVHMYPDGASFRLRRRLAAKLDVRLEEVFVGNGSNEIIDLLVRTFCTPGLHDVLAPAHTFVCYSLAAYARGVEYREAARGPAFAYDVDALLAAVTPRTRVVFLANPDNPTGVHMGARDLDRLVAELPAHVILAVDEAYSEYVRATDGADLIPRRAERELMIVMRTFSKIYGLAGARCGYAVGSPELLGFLDRVRNPFNVSSLAQAAALAALDDDAHVTRSQRTNAEGMIELGAGLERLGVAFTPSQANFILVDTGGDARALFDRMLARGVIVRPVGGAYGLPRHLRVTVGTSDENQRLLAALAAELHAGASHGKG